MSVTISRPQIAWYGLISRISLSADPVSGPAEKGAEKVGRTTILPAIIVSSSVDVV